MQEQIIQMVRENPRTVKELADALGLSKQEIFAHLSGLPVEAMRTVHHNKKGCPAILICYAMKKGA